MELKQLIYFKRAAEYQHMTRAADSLGVAQPFLSKAISALEEELGVELFDHVGRNIRLNQNGECFYKRVSELLSGLEDACKEVQRLNAFAQNANISIGSNVALYMFGAVSYTHLGSSGCCRKLVTWLISSPVSCSAKAAMPLLRPSAAHCSSVR